MRQLTYKTQWRALESIKRHLSDRSLISWYGTDWGFVLIVRRGK